MEPVEVKIYFYIDGEWEEIEDVMQDPSPTWEYGIRGVGPFDRVATTGFLTFTLDNTAE
jgi:hypothetical protein